MAKYNIYHNNGDRVLAEKGSYAGKKGTVQGTEYHMFSDAQFLIKFDGVEYPVWVNSWDLWGIPKSDPRNTLVDLYEMKPGEVVGVYLKRVDSNPGKNLN